MYILFFGAVCTSEVADVLYILFLLGTPASKGYISLTTSIKKDITHLRSCTKLTREERCVLPNDYHCYPGERRTAGNGRDPTENTRKLEAVFRWISTNSSAFRQDPSGNHRKKSGALPTGILLACSRYFPEGSGDFPVSFLEDPVAGTIELGTYFH